MVLARARAPVRSRGLEPLGERVGEFSGRRRINRASIPEKTDYDAKLLQIARRSELSSREARTLSQVAQQTREQDALVPASLHDDLRKARQREGGRCLLGTTMRRIYLALRVCVILMNADFFF